MAVRAAVFLARCVAVFFLIAAFLTFLWGTYNATTLWWYFKAPWSTEDPPAWQVTFRIVDRQNRSCRL